jgi:hypothetical protein
MIDLIAQSPQRKFLTGGLTLLVGIGTERLYIHGQWQEELFPRIGSNSDDLRQYQVFLKVMTGLSSRFPLCSLDGCQHHP